MNTEVLHLFIPGRGVASARPRGDFYDMEHPSSPGSSSRIVRATHKSSMGTFVLLTQVDPRQIVTVLSTSPEEVELPLRQRLRKWDGWVKTGAPKDLARIVGFQWFKWDSLFDSERRLVVMARALLRQCLDALPPSLDRDHALRLLDNPPPMPQVLSHG